MHATALILGKQRANGSWTFDESPRIFQQIDDRNQHL
jgi:hypothetical protein